MKREPSKTVPPSRGPLPPSPPRGGDLRDTLNKIITLLNKVMVVAGGVAVLLLMTLATVNVCLRVVHMPFQGAYELVSFLGAVVIAFALGYTQQKKGHIVVDILSETFPPTVKRLLDGVSLLLTFAFFLTLSWIIFSWAIQIQRSGEVSETLKIIHYPFIFCVALGFLVFSLTLLNDFLDCFGKKGESK